MTVFTLKTIYLFLYIFIASQGMFYMIGISRALRTISLPAFLEQRKAVDAVIGDPLRFLYFSAIGIGLITLILAFKHPKSALFISVLLSFLFLIADLYLAISRSIPLNDIINHYPSNKFPNIEAVRKDWLDVITYRGLTTITGLLFLLAGFLIESSVYYIRRVEEPLIGLAEEIGV